MRPGCQAQSCSCCPAPVLTGPLLPPRPEPPPSSSGAKDLPPQSPCVAEGGLQTWAPWPVRGKVLSLPRAPAPYPLPAMF